MKVLISHDSGAHLYDRMGFKRVLDYCGHPTTIWKIGEKSAFDAFNEVKPDLFIGQLHNMDRATMKCLNNYTPRCILKAGHWGEVDGEIDPQKYPVLVATEQHKAIASALKELGLLDFIFVHYHPNQIDRTMGSWRSVAGIEAHGIMNAFDPFIYSGGEVKPEFECDLSIVSGYWAYKAQNLNRYILPLCNPVGKYNIKIYGNSHWPVGQYVGAVHEENVKHIFRSTKINIDCHEPHGPEFGFDITERIFKVIGAGGFYLSGGYVESAHMDLFPKLVIWCGKTPEEFKEKIKEVLSWSQEERDREAKHQQSYVLNQHTYFDRVAQVFQTLGFGEESDAILEKKVQYLSPN